MPWHFLKLESDNSEKQRFLEAVTKGIESYEKLLEQGIPRESARYCLPFCQAVGIYHFTINLRSLLNFLNLRLCVRVSPEMRCLTSQLYFYLMEELPIMKSMVGCRGFAKGICLESNVTGVRKGEQHPNYPVCLFKNSESDIFIPTKKELKAGAQVVEFNKESAVEVQERVFRKWVEWEG